MAIGLKLTKAALLAFLKKNRKPLQTWEAKKNLKMGISERSFLRRDPHVRSRMGKKGEAGLGPVEMQLGELLGQAAPVKRAMNILADRMAVKRRKVTRAVKKYRKKGGKLSDYKIPNPVYQTVKKLRKLQAKPKKSRAESTMFNYPR